MPFPCDRHGLWWSGISEFFGDDPLVGAGVLELREEILLPDVEVKFPPGHFWGTEGESDHFVQLQPTAMALNTCVDTLVISYLWQVILALRVVAASPEAMNRG